MTLPTPAGLFGKFELHIRSGVVVVVRLLAVWGVGKSGKDRVLCGVVDGLLENKKSFNA